MVDALFAHSNYQGLKKMLDATVMRHEAIASNLANIETPNYKRIDVAGSFGTELSRAIAGNKVSEIQRLEPALSLDRTAVAGNRDGNTVQLDTELIALQKNNLAHQLQTQFLSGRFSKLKTAIKGQ
jgi:flagellar basal-body rod protein FlgB